MKISDRSLWPGDLHGLWFLAVDDAEHAGELAIVDDRDRELGSIALLGEGDLPLSLEDIARGANVPLAGCWELVLHDTERRVFEHRILFRSHTADARAPDSATAAWATLTVLWALTPQELPRPAG